MKGLLKFITCGSVDDGKSTLIGHILYDSKLLYADQEKALELDSRAGSRGGKIDYSLLLDGLTEEREQGITIDVAYRYFTTDRRSFIVADTPGHEEYTRNMAVGASFADLAVILVDASRGVLSQTRRHARICTLMGIRYYVFALNKMDLVGYREEIYRKLSDDIRELAAELELGRIQIIPVSATEGDNVTKSSARMSWYDGPSILTFLENIDIEETIHEDGFYLPVQRVCRPDHTFRGYQGQIEAGRIRVGEEIEVLPSRERACVRGIYVLDGAADSAKAGQPVTIQLDREIDISRGCVLSSGSGAGVVNSFTATLLWMDEEILENGRGFFVKVGTRLIPGLVTRILTVIDVNTGEKHEAESLHKNEIADCRIALTDQIAADEFDRHRTLGELILIDRVTNHTSACGVIRSLQEEETQEEGNRNQYLRFALKGQHPAAAVFVKGEDGIDAERLGEIENRLTSQYGRHVYTYLPESDEAFQTVTHHLLQAGLVVLLLLDADQAAQITASDSNYIQDWRGVTDPQAIARIIRNRSGFGSHETVNGEYI